MATSRKKATAKQQDYPTDFHIVPTKSVRLMQDRTLWVEGQEEKLLEHMITTMQHDKIVGCFQFWISRGCIVIDEANVPDSFKDSVTLKEDHPRLQNLRHQKPIDA